MHGQDLARRDPSVEDPDPVVLVAHGVEPWRGDDGIEVVRHGHRLGDTSLVIGRPPPQPVGVDSRDTSAARFSTDFSNIARGTIGKYSRAFSGTLGHSQ